MPEGPEIRLAADKLRRVLAGRQSTEVRFAGDRFPHLQRFGARLSGRMIDAVEPRGKAMLTHFEGGLSIYSHNQLYGEWATCRGAPPPWQQCKPGMLLMSFLFLFKLFCLLYIWFSASPFIVRLCLLSISVRIESMAVVKEH